MTRVLPGTKHAFLAPFFNTKNEPFAKTGLGQVRTLCASPNQRSTVAYGASASHSKGGGGKHEQGQGRVTQESTTQYLPAEELRC